MWRLIFILYLIPYSVSAQLKRFQFSENKMGSPFNIIFYHTDSSAAIDIAHHCFLLIDSLNNIFSDYETSSEVGMLSAQASVQNQQVSDELYKMILFSKQAWKRSAKTFDITTGTLTQLWRNSKKENRFPTDEAIRKAKQTTGFENLIISNTDKTISFKKNGMHLDFGGIVKGYTAQRVVDYLKTKNIKQALADAGGDIVMSDPPPEKNGWIVGINLPEHENELWDKKLELKNCAVATSGDVYRYTVYEGKKYSHILDPRTGYGVTSQRNVTVIANDGATADWLATACSILPIKKALRLAKKEDAEILIAILKNEKIISYITPDFTSRLKDEQIH